MTTIPHAAPTPPPELTAPEPTHAPAPDARPVPFTATLGAEWRKLTSVRATWVNIVAGTLVGAGLTALVSAAIGATWREWPEAELAAFEPVLYSLIGTIAPAVALTALAAKAMTDEYASGMVRLTMTVTPRRGRVLAAKATVVAVLTGLAGAVAMIISFLVGQALFAGAGLPAADLGDPAARRALGLSILVAPVLPLVGLALGVLLRSTAAAVTVALALIMVPSVLGAVFPPWWQENVIAYLPGPAMDGVSLAHLGSVPVHHSVGVNAAVLGAWLAAAATASFAALVRRDV
jgi:ABC-2 type transport system permease protein